ncbi:hypothetical protein ACFC0X_27910 [Paenibacillus chitinolyticus]|uniref:hypothetical protein n=1 Tax=Paenibacillus chitinolyticus TaxID=79263 RepID=UPI0035DA139E
MIAEAPESPGGLGGESFQTKPDASERSLLGGAILYGDVRTLSVAPLKFLMRAW